MSTRALVSVIKDKKVLYASSVGYDGYPSGLGYELFNFIKYEYVAMDFKRNMDSHTFENTKVNDYEGVSGLRAIQNGKLKSSPNQFKFGKSIFCDWAWIINLDTETLDCYTSYADKKAKKGSLFYVQGEGTEFALKHVVSIPFEEIKNYEFDETTFKNTIYHFCFIKASLGL